MARLSDPDRLFAYNDALANWTSRGYVEFDLSEEAYRWVRRELDSVTLREIARLMHEYIAAGGTIDEVVERRPEWSDEYEFHHDLRFEIGGRRAYVETRLHYRLPVEPDASSIVVVNIHEV